MNIFTTSGQQKGKKGEVGELGEFYTLHHTVQNAQHLRAFVNANDDQTRIMLGNQQFHQFAADETRVGQEYCKNACPKNQSIKLTEWH